nr:hypothetical protein [Lachnospiraceae bacterium]
GGIVIAFVLAVVKKTAKEKRNNGIFYFIFVLVLYLLIIAKVSPDMMLDDWNVGSRYIWIVYPVIVLSVVSFVYKYVASKKILYVVLGLLLVLTAVSYTKCDNLKSALLHEEVATIVEDAKEVSQIVVVTNKSFVYKDILEVVNQIEYNRVICIEPVNLESFVEENGEEFDKKTTLFITTVDYFSYAFNGDTDINIKSLIEENGFSDINSLGTKGINEFILATK